jgi:hypothetical protein
MLTALCALFLGTFSPQVHAGKVTGATKGVRLLSHFHKKVDGSLGVGGWLVMPDIVKAGTTPLFLVGPRYSGKGYWAEFMLGGVINKGVEDPAFVTTKVVQSTRFQMTPKFFDAPINVWGDLEFIDVTGDNMMPYLFLQVNYVLDNKVALIGIETENLFNKPAPTAEDPEAKANDIGIGPQLVLPFDGLNVIMAYQFHTAENALDQVWIRLMYNFGGFGK